MPRVKLDATQCLIASCPPGKRKETYWDTVVTDFVLEVRPGGGKTYALRYFDEAQRQRQIKIGGYADITFDKARKKAKLLRSEVTLGGDPAAAKDRRKATPTYAEIAAQHLDYAKTYQKRPSNTEAVIRRHLLPRWGKARLNEITQPLVAKWLAEKRETFAPATVEKIRVVFNRSFELANRWNVPGAERNPVKGIPRPKYNNSRERFLSPEEAARLLEATEASPNPQLRNIVALLLLTGARKMELLKAQWRHVDLDRKVWHIPDSKTGKARYVPLSQAAIDVIKRLPKFDRCSWLIANPETRRPYVDIKRAWDTARQEACLPDVRLHDLRHSAASFMINAGIDLYAVGRVLGHADHQSTVRYSHLANDTLLAAVEAGAARMQMVRPASGGDKHGL